MLKSENIIQVKVPGSIMLMGEHAVLFGYNALACAVDKHITVKLTPTKENVVKINSSLEQYESSLLDLKSSDKLSFVVSTIYYFKSQLIEQVKTGFILDIKSDFSSTLGLGSSAAVSVGVVAVLSSYLNKNTSYDELFKTALIIVKKQQKGRGSGTDIAASLYGGIIEYNLKDRMIQIINKTPLISLYYAGYKTKTEDVLSLVEKKAQQHPLIYQKIYQLMGQISNEATDAILLDDWPKVGRLMGFYQGLMQMLGVSDKTLSAMICQLISNKSVLGAKISGSGLGDCVMTLNQNKDFIDLKSYQKIDVQVSQAGLQWLLT